eukprot:Lankesteria_metandrocarpae@DN7286_c0_g1_i1.p1
MGKKPWTPRPPAIVSGKSAGSAEKTLTVALRNVVRTPSVVQLLDQVYEGNIHRATLEARPARLETTRNTQKHQRHRAGIELRQGTKGSRARQYLIHGRTLIAYQKGW